MTMPRINPSELRARFDSPAEFALVDVREEGNFARGHLLAASNLPLSHLELLIDDAVPRRQTEIILCDEDSAPAAKEVLTGIGYHNLTVLAGGGSGWALEGGKLFSGVNVPGKAFGEFVEKSKGTPSVSAPELKALLESKQPPVLLDTRTPQEHRSYCIPGALSCPNGELVYRVLSAIDSPERLVVTHCAGRTRSIIGAQTLIDAGIENPVWSLENGTLAWEFENYALEHGANRPLPVPGNDDLGRALDSAANLRNRHGVDAISLDILETWRQVDEYTLYLIDVRSAEEYASRSLAGSRHVPGGQLVQNVDRYMVTHGARTVLIDTDGVRASASAAWLKQMGWTDVHTLTLAPVDPALAPSESETISRMPSIDAVALRNIISAATGIVVDVRSSVSYRQGHIPDAWFLTRGHIEQDQHRLPDSVDVVLVADDGRYAALLATDLERHGRRVWLLEGGMHAWEASGQPVETGTSQLASEPDDVFLDSTDFDDPTIQAREGRAYLEWEIGLVHQLQGDPGAPYAS